MKVIYKNREAELDLDGTHIVDGGYLDGNEEAFTNTELTELYDLFAIEIAEHAQEFNSMKRYDESKKD